MMPSNAVIAFYRIVGIVALLGAVLPASAIAPRGVQAEGLYQPVPTFELLQDQAHAPTSPTASPEPGEFEPGVVLVKLREGVSALGTEAVMALVAASEVDQIPEIGVRKWVVPEGRESATVSSLLKNSAVQFAELNGRSYGDYIPDDPKWPGQWNMTQISAPFAWDTTYGSSAIRVAVVDSGIDVYHIDKPHSLLFGADYVVDPTGNTRVSGDVNGHGTHVSGIIAAATNNGWGVAGLAPDTTLLAVRATNSEGWGKNSDISAAIIYAAYWGAKVINLSMGGGYSSSIHDAVNYALSSGAIIVASAGNSYLQGNPVHYPAALPGVLAVGATTYSDARASYSQVQSYVALSAPGGDATGAVLSTCPSSTYCYMMGTSMAAPHVAGAAALVWSVNPGLTRDQVIQVLESTAIDLGPPGKDDMFGYGRIDVAAAVRKAMGGATITVDSPSAGGVLRSPAVIRGWAIDRSSQTGAGVNGIHIYLDGPAGTGQFVGQALYGYERADIGNAYGARFTYSGFDFEWKSPPQGSHSLYIYGHSSVTDSWDYTIVPVNIGGPVLQVDSPRPGATSGGRIQVQGWALDTFCSSGTGISTIHIYRDMAEGRAVPLAIPASYGSARNDVGTAYGESRFNNSGFSFTWDAGGLSGPHTLHVFAQRSCDGAWVAKSIEVNLPTTIVTVDSPAPNQQIGGSIEIKGWAIDPTCGTGSGVSAVHMYRDLPSGAGAPLAIPAAYGIARPSVGAVYGSGRFVNSGFSFTWNTSGLSGARTLHIFAQRACDGTWTETVIPVQVIRTLVQVDGHGGSSHYGSDTVVMRGWAIDPSCGTGTGVRAVHVYREASGGVPIPLAIPATIVARPDVAAAYGSSRYTNSGFTVPFRIGPAPGWHTVRILAQNACDGAWTEKRESIYIY